MSTRRLPPEVQALHDERLSAEDLRRWLATPTPEEDYARIAELVRWFTRRYPTVCERLAYARRAYARCRA